uniref:DNA polymerase III delta N-terminal domain-containing protein n=1 Tax=candidate division WOR-3 bacterium TaxID=2052148 RepID=A0A7V1EI11_UNCW3
MIDTANKGNSKDIIYNHYLIMSDEQILIDNTINDIKKTLRVDESFDFETCSIQEYEYPDIINKIFTSPFVSTKRILVLKNIEKKKLNELQEFAKLLKTVPESCCLIMVYCADKKLSRKKVFEDFKKVSEIFSNAHPVTLMPDDTTVYRWIMKKVEGLGLKDRHEIIDYLMEEFSDDITGMKNEIQKIENYLYQTRQMGLSELKDISQGLTDYDIYNIANNFFQRKTEALNQFIRIQPYMRSPMVLIDALARVLCNYAKKSKDEKIIQHITSELSRIDNRVKTGSDFVELNLEIFFIKNLGGINKGAIYGK